MNPYKYSLTTRLKEEYILKQLKPETGDLILDIGCGNGFYCDILSSRKNIIVIGLDFSIESLEVAKEWYSGEYVQGDALVLPFKNSSFPKILITDVIEHLKDDEQAMAEIMRVAKKGATVVITTPALEGHFTGSRLNLLFHNDPSSPEYHVKSGYSTQQMKMLMRNKGIEMIAVDFSTTFFSEIIIELLKLVYYFKKGTLHSQADITFVKNSKMFIIYKKVFPIIFKLSKFEERFLGRFLKGHVLIAKGIVL